MLNNLKLPQCKTLICAATLVIAIVLVVAIVLIFNRHQNAVPAEPQSPNGSNDEIIFSHTVSKFRFNNERFLVKFFQKNLIKKKSDLSSWGSEYPYNV